MIFWFAAALLTVTATMSAVLPLLSRRARNADALGHDREIYRARLSEIDADKTVGRISADEAEAARAEEGRKLIALANTPGAAPSLSSERQAGAMRNVALIAVTLFVPAMAVLLYASWGSPGRPDMAMASRDASDPASQSVEQLLQRAEAQLTRQPDDLRGWLVVAPVYMRLGRTQESVIAWRNAQRLTPDDPEVKTALGEAITVAGGGVVTEEARKFFQSALDASPKDAKARFYLAIALGQEGAFEEAARAWRPLIAEAPAEAPWLPVAKAQLAEAEQKTGVETGDAEAPGPTVEDIAEASKLPADEQRAMIETMVAGLAEKLKENPDDRQGWQRLVRSYVVLNRGTEAQAAIAAARKQFGDDIAFIGELEEMAKAAGARDASESTQ